MRRNIDEAISSAHQLVVMYQYRNERQSMKRHPIYRMPLSGI